jgi:carbon monoxide dehydrogenase subunit G
MKVQRSFTVPAPPAAVLAGLTDVTKIAECLPGGLVDGRERGGRFGGSFALQLGTATAPYTAIIAVPERDDASGRAVVTVSGHDDQGDGTAEVTATFAVRAQGDMTAVDLELDVELGGRLAQAPDVEATASSYARTSVAALRSSVAAPAEPLPPPPPEAAVSEEPLVPVMPPTPPPVRAPPGEAGWSAPHPPEAPPSAAAEPEPPTPEPEPTASASAEPESPTAVEPPPPIAAEPIAPEPAVVPQAPEPEPEPPVPASGPPATEPPPPAREPPPPAPEPPAPAPEPEPTAERTESVAPPGYQRQGTAPPTGAAGRKPKASPGGGSLLGRLRGLLKRRG